MRIEIDYRIEDLELEISSIQDLNWKDYGIVIKTESDKIQIFLSEKQARYLENELKRRLKRTITIREMKEEAEDE